MTSAMKQGFLFTITLLVVGAVSFISFTAPLRISSYAPRISTIIVDAGHGYMGSMDKRNGASGDNHTEDQISYEVTKRLVEALKISMPDVVILESRPTPFYVGLKERAEFANRNKGNLFISVHCNWVPPLREVIKTGTRTQTYYVKSKGKKIKKTKQVPVYKTIYHPNPAKGTETYVFASHKSEDKEEIILENGDVFQNEKEDSTLVINYTDPIVKQQAALWTKQFFTNSVKLASLVEEEFVSSGRFSRGVKQRQKGIWVLQATAMPSILIELGFLSNSDEEAFLASEEGQLQTAEAISKAVRRYKDLIEKGAAVQAAQTKTK